MSFKARSFRVASQIGKVQDTIVTKARALHDRLLGAPMVKNPSNVSCVMRVSFHRSSLCYVHLLQAGGQKRYGSEGWSNQGSAKKQRYDQKSWSQQHQQGRGHYKGHSGIQCLNCFGWGHKAKQCKKKKWQ